MKCLVNERTVYYPRHRWNRSTFIVTDTITDLNKPDWTGPDRPVERRMFVWPLVQKYSEESILDCHSVWIVCYVKGLIYFYHVTNFLNTFVAVTDVSKRDRSVYR